MTALEQTSASIIAPSTTSEGFLKRILPQRWYVHIILILSVTIIGFPMFYAVLVSTQDNGQVFSYQFMPGPHFMENLDVVLNQRGLLRYMINSIGISVIF